jgi:hypothetical protein
MIPMPRTSLHFLEKDASLWHHFKLDPAQLLRRLEGDYPQILALWIQGRLLHHCMSHSLLHIW